MKKALLALAVFMLVATALALLLSKPSAQPSVEFWSMAQFMWASVPIFGTSFALRS